MPAALRRLARLATAHLRAAYAYAPPRLACPVTLAVPEGRAGLALWEEAAGGGLAVHRLRADHYGLLREPSVAALAGIASDAFGGAPAQFGPEDGRPEGREGRGDRGRPPAGTQTEPREVGEETV